MKHPDWSTNASIYEVNLRQYTPQGSIGAFAAHLPRLRRMGVGILWLMPVQPIGVRNRKGTLGSQYSVSDYTALNPEFGTLGDLRRLVDSAHALGMHVILDWVANHTAWDHRWVAEHPGWYLKDAAGEIHSYVYDNGRELEHWTDVVGLDYRQPAVWDAMIAALEFWVTETGIDGYRCDVAGLLPMPFWERARARLDAIKPVFMLAEGSAPEMHARAFDMTYDWSLHDAMKKIARGDGDAADLVAWLERSAREFPPDAYRMTFTTNHDKNAWEGHDVEVFGDSFKVFAVLAATLPGMPLIYGGQEAVLDRRLAFFEQDTIDWKDCALADFYTGLLQLKARTPALWNGAAGAPARVLDGGNRHVFAFRRADRGGAVTVAANLSASGQDYDLGSGTQTLAAWSYRIDLTRPDTAPQDSP